MTELTLAALGDADWLAGRLAVAGLAARTAEEKARRFGEVADVLLAQGSAPTTAVVAYFVPGRIEVLGKHTDYAGGRSLVAAAERGFCAVGLPRDEPLVRIVDAVRKLEASFALSPSLAPAQGCWSNYPMTVARRMAMNFAGRLRGANIAFASDLPAAAGMSSSSALIVMTFLLLADINRLSRRPEFEQHLVRKEDLAGYLGTIESGQSFGGLIGDRGVGTFGGSEDHTAILCSQPRQLTQFSYCPVRRERFVAMPADHVFVIGVSGVVAEKTGTAMERYNRASRMAAAIARIWREVTGGNEAHLAAAIASAPDAPDRIRAALGRHHHADFDSRELLDRFEQFLAESEEIVPNVPDVIDWSNLSRFGQLVHRSQTLGAQLLRNQLPQTLFLAEQACKLGAVAASAFGAGFGGSVWALARRDQAGPFAQQWAEVYRKQCPAVAKRADFFATDAGPAAFALSPVPP